MFSRIKCNNYSNELKLILELSKNDFKVRYAGSVLGILWGFIQPLMTILVYWFVFEVGLRTGARPDGTPFILWLTCGIIPWFFFAESWVSSANSFLEYSYLVKKVNFRIGVLPLVKIVSAFYVHLFFLCLLIAALFLYGKIPNWTYFQSFYYLSCAIYLLLGLSLIFSSLVVFLKDFIQILGVCIQIGFWIVPIVWPPEILSNHYEKMFKLNPLYYIIEGYRDSFINHVWFWQHYNQTIYFWTVSTMILLVGLIMFLKLKPHFADVL